jgi:hypothetical protein
MKAGNVVIVAIIILILLFNFFYRPHRPFSPYNEATISGGIFEIPYVSDSLPHYEYKRITDSIESANLHKQEKKHTSGTGWGSGFIGIGNASYARNDTTEYYLKLEQYLPYPEVEFYERENRNYFKKVVWDKKGVEGNSKHWVGHHVSEPTPVKFVETSDDSGSGEVLIPTSKLMHDIVEALAIASMILGIAISLYIFYNFLKLLIRIAKGKIFVEENLQVLFHIAWFLIALGVVSVLTQTVFYFVFKSDIPNVLRFQFAEVLQKSSGLLIIGLLVLLLARIFKRGYELQSEQELTV